MARAVLVIAVGVAVAGVSCQKADAPGATPKPTSAPTPGTSTEPLPTATALPASRPAPAAAPESLQAPASLSCIARHYAGRPEHREGRWFLVLPDGAALAYDDARAKTPAEAFDAPDVEDTFTPPYAAGPIVPIVDPDQDPGRNRVDALFAATYGKDAKEVRASLVSVRIAGQSHPVHRRALPAFERVAARLDALLRASPALAGYFKGMGGSFVWRTIAGSTKVSTHAYGIALDIGTAHADYWRNAPSPPKWRSSIPEPIVRAFEAEGFVWGGRWYHYDTMHFEYRPELLDPACYPSR